MKDSQETRHCGDCKNARNIGLNKKVYCPKLELDVGKRKRVRFNEKDGTCWEPKG